MQIRKKVCIIGDPAVGKTSLLSKYLVDLFDTTYIKTVGAKVSETTVTVDKLGRKLDVILMLWDVVGQKEYHALHTLYFCDAHIGIAVADLSRKETLTNLPEWISSLRDASGQIPVVFVGNKADLDDHEFRKKELAAMAGRYFSKYFITSAKTGENVQPVFDAVANLLTEKD